MIIDTSSRLSTEKSLLSYFGITREELYKCIDKAYKEMKSESIIDTSKFENSLKSTLFSIETKEKIDQIYVYHLTRRLDELPSETYNLIDLLSNENSLTNFLKEYDVSFKRNNNQIDIFYKNKKVLLNNSEKNSMYILKKRLGHIEEYLDSCFNGFIYKDYLEYNFYYKELSRGSEFISALSNYLDNPIIQNDFCKKSKYYCYTYKLPIDLIIFDALETDENDIYDEKITIFLTNLCLILQEYRVEESCSENDSYNLIVRLDDYMNIPKEYLHKIEEISE